MYSPNSKYNVVDLASADKCVICKVFQKGNVCLTNYCAGSGQSFASVANK